MDESGDNQEEHGRKQPSAGDALRTWPIAEACLHRPCSCKSFFLLCTSSEEGTSCLKIVQRVILMISGMIFGIAMGAPFGFAFGAIGGVLMLIFLPCYIRTFLKDALLESVDENGQLPKNKFFHSEPYTPNASFQA
ncbi:unnamed protein product [Oikopleura dioica]|uniref:Uncharacterized protein n=1 Tax=Oikopleura dioica TaxID=34765 RepID=E4WX22_OIKDI|nr:unnamed protein product [Oikopleura dioica]CBY31010.1 unnamed protein product [Oikopleura dioica]CBY40229.1 unnamed protein product [Oikopleura dioica]